MSWLSKFVFDPIAAAISRAAASSHPGVAQAATQLEQTYAKVSTTLNSAASAGISVNSAPGLANDVIGAFENGLNAAVDALVTGLVGEIPVVGAGLAPEAVKAANVSLAFLEAHGQTYLSALLGHAKAQINATPIASQPIGNPGS